MNIYKIKYDEEYSKIVDDKGRINKEYKSKIMYDIEKTLITKKVMDICIYIIDIRKWNNKIFNNRDFDKFSTRISRYIYCTG